MHNSNANDFHSESLPTVSWISQQARVFENSGSLGLSDKGLDSEVASETSADSRRFETPCRE
jgi:hypothetical protein